MAAKQSDDTEALTALIKLLKPLASEDRQRTIQAAMLYLGEGEVQAAAASSHGSSTSSSSGGSPAPSGMGARLKQYGLTSEQVETLFDFRDDGSFALLDLPGGSIRERAHHAYILAGLGTFLGTGQRAFTDAVARGYCEEHGCLDVGNHSKMLNGKHPEFSGDKSSGWNMSVPGLKRGAELVREHVDKPTK